VRLESDNAKRESILYVRYSCLTVTDMSNLTVTAKGQVTLRKDLLRHLGVQPGGKLSVEKLPDGRIQVRAERPTAQISDVFNSLRKPGQSHVSIEEMNEIAAEGWAAKR